MAKAKSSNPQNKNEDKVKVEGKVIAVLPDTKYQVEIEVGGFKHVLIGYPSGKIRKNYIKLAEQDEVVVEIAPEYDMNVGRIVWKKNRRGSMPAGMSEGIQESSDKQTETE